MIRRIEARNYRCLRHVEVELDRFQLAVGPNASGKSTLFDAVSFLGDVIGRGLQQAVSKRTQNLQDLVWSRPSRNLRFELAVELDVPEGTWPSEWREARDQGGPWRYRHELVVGEIDRVARILEERGLLLGATAQEARLRRSSDGSICLDSQEPSWAPESSQEWPRDMTPGGPSKAILFARSPGSADRSVLDLESDFSDRERARAQEEPVTVASLKRVILALLPEVYGYQVRAVLARNVRLIQVDARALQAASSPLLRSPALVIDGANLPWLIAAIQENHAHQFEEWMDLVRSTLPDVRTVEVNEREDERTAYLLVEYANGLRAPSWVVSEGTLRFLLLSLIPFLPSSSLYLLEEPENGFHPFVLDAVYSSLACPGSSQVIAATHSTELVRLASPEEILCFRRDAEGATEIIRGTDHPIFRDADDEPDVRLLFSTLPFD